MKVTDTETRQFYEFEAFRVDTVRRKLFREGRPQPITPKALEILLVLLQRRGQVIQKDELMRTVWPDTIVEENNLTRNISALRKALGEGPQDHNYVVTVPGRGYSFVAKVSEPAANIAPSNPETQASKSTDSDIPPNNLSDVLTLFIGRREELAQIESLLKKPELHLLTLTGAGGSGKTRLALQVAADLLPKFKDGVFLVPLAPIHEPDLVGSAIAQALRITETSSTPLIETLANYLRHKKLLLVLDNFEQVVAAAPLLTELLRACKQLKILVTSRAALHLSCEHEFPVSPLPLPDLSHSPSSDALSQNEAVALFIQRARAVKPNFEINDENGRVIAEICIRLDGLPLAIELAAARVKLLPPPTMLARLERRLQLLVGGPRDLPARQQTMRDTIAWSYELLDDDAMRLFRRLAVFVGGITLESGEAVCNIAEEVKIDFLETVASLVDKNLLVQKQQVDDQPRFMMFETFREYALEQLARCGEATSVRQHHAKFFLGIAEQADPKLSTAEQAVWLERLEVENDNLRAALRWAKDDDIELGSRLAAALARFWLMRGYYTEGRERLAEVLASAGGSAPPELRTKLLNGAGTLAQNQGDYPAARSFFDNSLTIWREVGNKEGIAASLNNLGWVAWRQSDYRAARLLSEEGLALNQELLNKQGVAHSLNNLGFVAHHEGDFASARLFHEESLSIRRELGDKRGIAFAQTNLGWAMHKLGDYERAAELLQEARVSFKQLGDKQLLAFSSNILAGVVHDQGNRQDAAELLEESVETCRDIGAQYSLASGLRLLGNIRHEQGKHQQAALLVNESLSKFREIGDRYGAAFALFTLAKINQHAGDEDRALSLLKESLMLRTEIGDKHGIFECLIGLATVALAQNQLTKSLRLAGAAETLRATLKIRRSVANEARRVRDRDRAQAELDNETVTTCYQEGCDMTLDQAVAFALT